ncbi:MAG: enolase C-terminal domain-like protein, partial [Candidatus Limnocylindrales bacterium]
MRITSITSRLIGVDAAPQYVGREPPGPGEARQWDYLVTTVSTDEGIDGYSMMWGLAGEARGLGHILRDVFASVVLGKDPLAIEARWQELRDRTRSTYPLSDSIVCLLDVALWDILGKATGRPIVDLLGRYRDAVPAYVSPSAYLSLTVEGTFEEATAVKAKGLRGYKLWSVLGPREDIPLLRAAREAVGPDFPLMADAGGMYRYVEAIEVGHVLDELNFRWYEEPISDYHIPLLRRLADELRTPILAGEKTTPLGYLPEY